MLIYRERHGARLVLALIAAAIGVGLLLSNELQAMAGSPLGTFCMLAAAASWAFGVHLLRRPRQPSPLVVLSFWMMAGSLASCALLSLVFERGQWVRWPQATEWAILVAIGATLIQPAEKRGEACYLRAARYLTASTPSIAAIASTTAAGTGLSTSTMV